VWCWYSHSRAPSNAKRFAEAEGFARRAVAIDPKNAVAWDRLGVALQARGVWTTETEQAYRRAVELDPQFAVAYAHLARTLNKMGRRAEAEPLYAQAIGSGQGPGYTEPLCRITAGRATVGQLGAGPETLARARSAKSYCAPLNVVACCQCFKRYSEAEPYLKQATEVSPKAFEPHHLLASAYLSMNRYQEAEVTIERALGFSSAGDRKQLAGIYGMEGVGDGYLKAGNKPGAARAYRRALELDPGNQKLEQKLAKVR
jgi:tetratricopeptide (TPR) repeat protein